MAKTVEGLYYSESHEWVKVEGNVAVVGITDFAPMDFEDANGEWVDIESVFYAENGFSRTLPYGEYRAQLLSYNSNAWESDGSDWRHTWADDVYFKIGECSHSYDDGKEVLESFDAEVSKTIGDCVDENNIPVATNIATAESLVIGLERGDLDWRETLHSKPKY